MKKNFIKTNKCFFIVVLIHSVINMPLSYGMNSLGAKQYQQKQRLQKQRQIRVDAEIARQLQLEEEQAFQLQQRKQSKIKAKQEVKRRPNGYIQLPKSLRTLPVQHARVTQQKTAACGPWAIANAAAVQTIVNSHGIITLTPANIQAHSHPLTGINIKDDEIRKQALNKNLEYAFIVGHNIKYPAHGESFEPFHDGYTFSKASFDNPATSLEEIRNMLLHNPHQTIHFIYNSGNRHGGHYVTISIIRKAGSAHQIIYMDSCNSRLTDKSVVTELILFLHNNLL